MAKVARKCILEHFGAVLGQEWIAYLCSSCRELDKNNLVVGAECNIPHRPGE